MARRVAVLHAKPQYYHAHCIHVLEHGEMHIVQNEIDLSIVVCFCGCKSTRTKFLTSK